MALDESRVNAAGKIIRVDHAKVAETVHDFPLLLEWTADSPDHADNFRILASDQATLLPHQVLSFDARTRAITVCVRVPLLSHLEDTLMYLRWGNSAPVASAAPVWDGHYHLVGLGSSGFRISRPLIAPEAITAEAWVDGPEPVAEAVQAVVSQWELRSSFSDFEAYDAGRTSGLETKGFFGAVFDGRFVYFVPQHDTIGRHGKVLRYDSQRPFKDGASWEAYDAGATAGLSTKGYYGAVYDGRYVTFIPRRDDDDFHSRILRYDTCGPFRSWQSWSAFDAGVGNSYQSAAFDGRYLYCAPGQESVPVGQADPKSESHFVNGMKEGTVPESRGLVMRIDSQGRFNDRSSYAFYDAKLTHGLDTRDMDGAIYANHAIYFVPLSYGKPLRYDVRRPFTDPASWAAFDASPLGLLRAIGAIFDGRHVYYVPYGETNSILRYDTKQGFGDRTSWESFDLRGLGPGRKRGYIGAVFDGRYVYFVPVATADGEFHGEMLRYDTVGKFTVPDSWQFADAGATDGLHTVGYNGAAFDGRFIYCAPWNDGSARPRIHGHGRVLRYDTAGPNSSFSLRYSDCGHNGGLGAALPGPRFIVATEGGVVSISANLPLLPGRRYLAGVYDGKEIKLFIDGRLANSQAARGKIQSHGGEFLIGSLAGGAAAMAGTVGLVQVSDVARSAGWIATVYANQLSPREFARLQPWLEHSRGELA